MTWDDGTPILDPITGEPPKDRTLAIAISEGKHYITKRGKPRTVVDWYRFMEKRRHYKEIPRYFGLTDQEVETYMKICYEALVPINVIGKLWGRAELKATIRFLQAKKIPVYRPPFDNGHAYYVFSGDIVRAIESCRIDMEADSGAWPKYMAKVDHWKKNKEIRDANRARAVREDDLSGPAGQASEGQHQDSQT